MKKFLKSVLLFLPIAAISYIVLVIIWGEFAPRALEKNINYRVGTNGHMFSRLQELEGVKDVDVLILGSSHAYRGFDIRIFNDAGIKAFNLGSSAQSPIQTEVLLKRHLEKLNPKVVIYEVYPFTFMGDGIESSLNIVSTSRNDRYSFEMAKKLKSIKTFNTLIYAYYCDLLDRNKSYKEPKERDGDTYISGGYVERKKEYFKNNVAYASRTWDVTDDQLKSFSENIKMLKDKNIRIILVYAPITKAFYKAYSNHDMFDKKMESFGEYYNFNNIPELNDSLHFYDNNHLNQDGVEIFNKNLLARIKSLKQE